MADSTPDRQTVIPPERKAAYYLGMALLGLGFLLFLSNFFTMGGSRITAPLGSPEWDKQFDQKFADHSRSMNTSMYRALGGMALIVAGGFLMRVGKVGLAGAGVVLDPQQARKDVEPWSRAVGGMMNDAVSEIDAVKNLQKPAEPPPPVVKVRCRRCQALNDEAARFCNQCAAGL
jgi:hypothetical protein